ncbi:MAG: aspartate aminotransferase family protein [Fervidicoccus fontis]|uniref:Ornithine aminotransferase n=1 Tax=Fervidicoccus fontis TaxID=683846 RepID=A0A2J6N716_9CREN|nr:MAG: aspartate aminotransferase family protein [Fervidicoccus fontis]PMB77137.1 MAG: aspartate aminotransferase family protein [Fervidicoccus fontis]
MNYVLTEKYLQERKDYVMSAVSLYHPITVVRGENAFLFDTEGKKYIDFTSGIGVTSLGHANPELIDAAVEQLRKLWHISIMNLNYPSYVELAKKISEISPGKEKKRVAFWNSGSEAIDNAIKVARQATGRHIIVAFENAFHGRGTYGPALAATGKYMPYKESMEPFSQGVELLPYPYCYRCPFRHEYPECGLACLDYMKKWFTHARYPPNRIAAFLMEMIQGEGGFVVPPKEYVKELKSFLESNGILLIDDEVQAGFARTGKMWAVEHFDVEPDIMAFAKAVANGLPLSGIAVRESIAEKVHLGSLGGTFGGNPVSCAVGLKVLEIMKRDNLPARAEMLGRIIRKRLEEMYEKYEIIGDVRGLGIMQAIEIVKDRKTKEPDEDITKKIINTARERGLLLLIAGLYSNVIRLHPPLTIEEDVLKRGLDILDESIKEALKKK